MTGARGMAKQVVATGPVNGRWPLPRGWSWRRAKELGRIVGGSTPKNASDPTNYSEDGIPWLTPADLSGYTRSTIGAGRRNLASHVVNHSALLPTRAVLISSRAPVGYCAVALNPMVTNQGFRSLVLADDVDPFFIRYYVLFSRRYLEDNASGTTFKELSGSALGDLVFPVPPLEVQQRIVARIDELFVEIDDGEAALRRARDDLATWRKALLKAAVTGELTADWRAANPTSANGGETGADLLARILDERRALWKAEPRNTSKLYRELEAPDLDGMPVLPESWTWTTAEALTSGGNDIIIGPFGSDLKTTDYRDEGVPLIFVRHIRTMDFSGLRPHFVSFEKAMRLDSHVARSGDVLVTKMGEPPGDAAVYPQGVADGIVTADCIRWRPSDILPSRFLVEWINSQAGRRWVASKTKGVAQQKITLALFRLMPVPVPPAAEVEAILGELGRVRHSVADLSEAEADAALMSPILRQSILAAAFRGDLA